MVKAIKNYFSFLNPLMIISEARPAMELVKENCRLILSTDTCFLRYSSFSAKHSPKIMTEIIMSKWYTMSSKVFLILV